MVVPRSQTDPVCTAGLDLQTLRRGVGGWGGGVPVSMHNQVPGPTRAPGCVLGAVRAAG